MTGAGSLCDRCDHGHTYRRRGARDVAVYCRSLRLSDMMDIALTIDPREGIDQRSYR